MDVYNTETLFLQIEELFERFRNLPQNVRALILEKIRIKLLEEFNDFVIEESDAAQELVVEIPFSNSGDIFQKNENFVVLPTDDKEIFETPVLPTAPPTEHSIPLLTVAAPTKPRPRRIKPTKKKKPKVENPRLMCNYCGKPFNRKNLFDRHIDRHKDERSYECHPCSLQFNVKDDLTKHKKSHSGVKKFVCAICQKRLVNKTTLENHIRIMHKKEEKYFCSKCDYFAFSKMTLREHIRVKHDKNFKKYACLICSGVYNSRVLLKVHLRSHTGEKPYSCNECDASFVTSGRLTNHKNSVHGERKFPCEICSKPFKTVHKLKRHSFVHTRIKPFACPFCTNYASNTQGNLSQHVKKVHQMPDFSYLKYKRIMRGEIEEVRDEWIENAQKFTEDYLKKLSENGEAVSIDQLKETYSMRKEKKVGRSDTDEVCDFDLASELNVSFQS